MNATDLHDSLREAIRRRADDLDGGVCAPAWVKALSEDGEVAAWESVLRDSDLLGVHRPEVAPEGPGSPRCAADGEQFPCEVLDGLLTAYEPSTDVP